MAFIEPMHRNKPNITYLLTLQISSCYKPVTRGAHYTEIELFSTMWKYNFEMYVTSNN